MRILEKINNLVKISFAVLAACLSFASCEMSPSSFYINFEEMQYGLGNDTIQAEIVSNDNGNFPVRDVTCYWTFDGSEPTDTQTENTTEAFDANKSGNEFIINIPSDFYSGTIKFLCKITYSAMGNRNTETRRIDKNFSVKYHSHSNESSVDLYKNKGIQKEYYINQSSQAERDTIAYNVKESGNIKITYLLGETSLTVSDFECGDITETTENGNDVVIYHSVPADTTIYVQYEKLTYIVSGNTSRIKSGEYLIVLE